MLEFEHVNQGTIFINPDQVLYVKPYGGSVETSITFSENHFVIVKGNAGVIAATLGRALAS